MDLDVLCTQQVVDRGVHALTIIDSISKAYLFNHIHARGKKNQKQKQQRTERRKWGNTIIRKYIDYIVVQENTEKQNKNLGPKAIL